MIRISYSTINSVRNCRQWWLCKISGLSKVDFPWFTAGKEAHNIIQAHLSGKIIDDRLVKSGIIPPEWEFPVVEEKDFDERTGFEMPFGKYQFRGFLDGLDIYTGKMVEIKTSSQPWTLKKFNEAIQKDIYALAFPMMKQSKLINCTKDLTNIKKYTVPVGDKNRARADKWINEGIDIIESGDYEGGENINCGMCIYRDSCPKSKCKNFQ
jgi:hypothetical protein